jgi:hypothetical protein
MCTHGGSEIIAFYSNSDLQMCTHGGSEIIAFYSNSN